MIIEHLLVCPRGDVRQEALVWDLNPPGKECKQLYSPTVFEEAENLSKKKKQMSDNNWSEGAQIVECLIPSPFPTLPLRLVSNLRPRLLLR